MAGVSWNNWSYDGGLLVYVELYTVNIMYDGDTEEVYFTICLFF
jgi:hypothetical protein